MIFVTNAEGRATFVSREWTEFTGQSLDDAVGFGWVMAVHPDDRAIARETVTAAIEARSAFSVRYRMIAPDGRGMRVAAGAVPSFGPPDGRFLGFLGSITPIADGLTEDLQADGSLGGFIPPPGPSGAMPGSTLEAMADHVLMAHALVEPAGAERLRPLTEQLLHEIGVELARAERMSRTQGAGH